MRIYPDPDLPDVEVSWTKDDCAPGTGDVVVSLVGVDTPSYRSDVTVACNTLKTTYNDVARERYRVEGQLLDTMGGTYSDAEGFEVDLRNGFNASASLYFGGFENFRIAWTFDMGASCDSLGADSVLVEFNQDDMQFGYTSDCLAGHLGGNAPPGTVTVEAKAFTRDYQLVAASPVSPPITIPPTGRIDLGTLVLSPP